MLKIGLSFLFSLLLLVSTNPIQGPSALLDSQGNLNLQQPEEVSAMPAHCKSYRISKNPPLFPRLKCRFS